MLQQRSISADERLEESGKWILDQGSTAWRQSAVLQLSLRFPTVHGSLMGRMCNEDPQVFGVGFLCTVGFIIANWEALLWRQNRHHTIKATSDLTGRLRTCWKEDPHSSE